MFGQNLLPYFSLFTSASTLICCALPAFFVALGAGAVFAGLVSHFPQLIWLSEHKNILFGVSGAMLVLAGISHWKSRKLPCPMDAARATVCKGARRWSKFTLIASIVIYLTGAGFAFLLG